MHRLLLWITALTALIANTGSILLLTFACIATADAHPLASLCAYLGGLGFILYLSFALKGPSK